MYEYSKASFTHSATGGYSSYCLWWLQIVLYNHGCVCICLNSKFIWECHNFFISEWQFYWIQYSRLAVFLWPVLMRHPIVFRPLLPHHLTGDPSWVASGCSQRVFLVLRLQRSGHNAPPRGSPCVCPSKHWLSFLNAEMHVFYQVWDVDGHDSLECLCPCPSLPLPSSESAARTMSACLRPPHATPGLWERVVYFHSSLCSKAG